MKYTLIVFFLSIQIIAKPCCCSRWDIKTLSDNKATEINFNSLEIDFKGLYIIDSLTFGNNQKFHSMTRLPDEKQVYRLKCKLIKWKIEDDLDYHLIVSSLYGDSTIICEIPSNECDSKYQTQFQKNREFIESIPAQKNGAWHIINNETIITIEGVAFHDFKHNSKNAAPNFLELHPILNIK